MRTGSPFFGQPLAAGLIIPYPLFAPELSERHPGHLPRAVERPLTSQLAYEKAGFLRSPRQDVFDRPPALHGKIRFPEPLLTLLGGRVRAAVSENKNAHEE